MKRQDESRGQSLLEVAIILPVLLIMLYGVVEAGFGLRNYLIVSNANREAARFAARGRFTDADVAARLISAGGVVRLNGIDVPFLRTYGADPNTGIIITHIQMDRTGAVVTSTRYITGVIAENGAVRLLMLGDSMISTTQVVNLQAESTRQINQMRSASGYDQLGNHILVVETFFLHHPFVRTRGLIPDPWVMYARTEMRIFTDRGQ